MIVYRKLATKMCEVQIIDMDVDQAMSSRLDRVNGTFAEILVLHCL